MPAKQPFCRLQKVYQTGRLAALRARLKLTAFCTVWRRFSSWIDAAISAARRRSSSLGAGGGSGASAAATVGNGPGANRSFATPRRSVSSAARWPSSNAQTESRVATWSVPSRPMRAGHALRAISAPAAAGHRSTIEASPACGPKRASSRRSSSDSLSRSHLHDLRRLGRQRRRLRRGHHGLLHVRNPRRQHAAAAGVELREDVVEQEQRARRGELRLREQQREQHEPLLALRAEAAQVAAAGRDAYVVEVRPEPGRPPRDVRLEAGEQRFGRGRLPFVRECPALETELAGAGRKSLRKPAERRAPDLDEPCAERGEARGPRLEGITLR